MWLFPVLARQPSSTSLPGQVYSLFLGLLTGSGSLDACADAFDNASTWFTAWAEAGRGDLAPDEMAIIVQQVDAACPPCVRNPTSSACLPRNGPRRFDVSSPGMRCL